MLRSQPPTNFGRELRCSVFLFCCLNTANPFALFPRRAPTSHLGAMKGSVFIATTLDGKIADPDGGVDFLNEFQEAPVGEGDDADMGYSSFMASVDVIVMGRKSFDKVVSFGESLWAYGETPVVVWTRSDSLPIPDYLKDKVTVSSLPPNELMADLEKQGKTHAYIDGGTTIQTFLNEGMVHQMIITTVPLLLGPGINLFGDTCPAGIKVRHLNTKSYQNGLVQSTYEVASKSSNES